MSIVLHAGLLWAASMILMKSDEPATEADAHEEIAHVERRPEGTIERSPARAQPHLATPSRNMDGGLEPVGVAASQKNSIEQQGAAPAVPPHTRDARGQPALGILAGGTDEVGVDMPAGDLAQVRALATVDAAPDQPADLVECPSPGYPDDARRSRTEGEVRCLLEIDERGVVGSVRVVHSSGSPLLDEAARAALLAWKYKPATRGGAPRACILEHVVTFRLPRAD